KPSTRASPRPCSTAGSQRRGEPGAPGSWFDRLTTNGGVSAKEEVQRKRRGLAISPDGIGSISVRPSTSSGRTDGEREEGPREERSPTTPFVVSLSNHEGLTPASRLRSSQEARGGPWTSLPKSAPPS